MRVWLCEWEGGNHREMNEIVDLVQIVQIYMKFCATSISSRHLYVRNNMMTMGISGIKDESASLESNQKILGVLIDS